MDYRVKCSCGMDGYFATEEAARRAYSRHRLQPDNRKKEGCDPLLLRATWVVLLPQREKMSTWTNIVRGPYLT